MHDERAERCLSISFYPVTEILPEFWMKDGRPLFLSQGPTLVGGLGPIGVEPFLLRLV